MTKQEYENKIKELQDELDQLKAAKIESEQPKRWKPMEDEHHCPSYELDNLREDWERAKAEYDWKEKITAERTERFEPPMWEDIENEWNFYFAKGKETYHFWVEKDCVGISKCEYLCDYWSDAHKTLFEEEATKENYEKACEIVRDLFKGESNGKNA